MISLTRLSGSRFALNSDLVERVDSTPDTVITLVDGKKYVVAETLEEVVATICRYRAEIIALSGHLQTSEVDRTDPDLPPDLHSTALAQLLDHHPRRPSLSVVDGREVTPR